MNTDKQMAAAAASFAERWAVRGYERGESQLFWADLLMNVYGVGNIAEFIRYEEQVKVDTTNFIDGHIPSTRVLIEQKSLGKDLRAGIRQSDGSVLNPFLQARRYVSGLPLSEHPRWIVTCNFAEFLVYDMEQPNREPESIMLENLGKEYYRLLFLVDAKSEHLSKEMRVSIEAGKIVGHIYEALLTQYDDSSPEALRWLNILCVRIVFCLYAEDAGVFRRDQFHDFLNAYEAKDLRRALRDLFEVLNTPLEQRSRYLQDDLAAFPYTNGGLFEEEIEIPQFTDALKQTLLQKAALDFDWSEISPTIFGAVFESTLNPETRRSGGMHYTSIANIHKVIDPLFLNDLRRELDDILEEKVERLRNQKLDAYQNRLASLTFLDPACGSGNFLTETYLSLRRLENEVIRERYHGQTFMGFRAEDIIKVSIQQFYGIEINDFAVTVATTALWISEAQMLTETERIVNHDFNFLPLKSYANIREGNALRMDWSLSPAPSLEGEGSSAPKHYDYIMGNPPFVGKKEQTKEQKDDLISLFDKEAKGIGNLDYVSGWYKKAIETIKESQTRVAFVSTNSITQGEQVPILWKELYNEGLKINFAHRSFRWDSEATQKAHVHCVVIGFSYQPTFPSKSNAPAQLTNSPSKLEGVAEGRGRVSTPSRTHNLDHLKDYRRDLRTHGTPAEGRLWNILKARQIDGLQFRRQFSIGRYILDFYCPAIRFAIELDGEYHYHGEQPEADSKRDETLKREHGIETLRLENKVVFDNPEYIIEKILERAADTRPRPSVKESGIGTRPRPSATPSNLEGELVSDASRVIYDGDRRVKAENINAYLIDAPDIFIEARTSPLSDVPEMMYGSMPIDDGHLILDREDADRLLAESSDNACFIRKYVGGAEVINNKERWCLWLEGVSPQDLRQSALMMERVMQTKAFRLKSNRPQTLKLANTPWLFGEIRQPSTNMLVVPKVSSEKRRYIPLAFIAPDVIVNGSALIVPNATLYDFGIIISNVHMAWMRTVCGRLETRYQYSANIVYNNFPWPTPTTEQRQRIEQTAQGILDARAKYPDSSPADLYDELTMPADLRRAHQDNDRAVMAAYGWKASSQFTESMCVAELFHMYQRLTEDKNK